jgi:hypothetical protein
MSLRAFVAKPRSVLFSSNFTGNSSREIAHLHGAGVVRENALLATTLDREITFSIICRRRRGDTRSLTARGNLKVCGTLTGTATNAVRRMCRATRPTCKQKHGGV